MKLSLHLLICLVFLSTISIFAQSETEKGIEFYRKKDYKSAIETLNKVTKSDKTDTEAWNVLGMAYLGISKFKESRKALETAVKQNPQNAAYHINLAYSNLLANKLGDAEKEIKKAIEIDSQNAAAYYISGTIFLWKGNFDNAISDADKSLTIDKTLGASYLLKSNAYLYKFGEEIADGKKMSASIHLLKKSLDALESCLSNCSQLSILDENRTRLEELTAFHKYFSGRKDEVFSSIFAKPAIPTPNVDPTVTPLTIRAKPRANYTESARMAGVQGTITLAILFSADGNKKMILVIKPLSNGLTEEGIKAAQQIKFNPQMKDGKPVSVVKMVQYTFTLY